MKPDKNQGQPEGDGEKAGGMEKALRGLLGKLSGEKRDKVEKLIANTQKMRIPDALGTIRLTEIDASEMPFRKGDGISLIKMNPTTGDVDPKRMACGILDEDISIDNIVSVDSEAQYCGNVLHCLRDDEGGFYVHTRNSIYRIDRAVIDTNPTLPIVSEMRPIDISFAEPEKPILTITDIVERNAKNLRITEEPNNENR